MRRSLLISVIAAVAPLLTPQSARAQILNTGSTPVCGGNAYLSCFSATVTISASTASSTTFDVWLKNMSVGSIFTQIGVGGLRPSNGHTLTSISGSVTSGDFGSRVSVVSSPNGLMGAGIDAPIFGLDAHGNNGLIAAGIAMFSFRLHRAPSVLDLAGVQIAVHDQRQPYLTGNCGGSNKAVYERTDGNTTAGTFLNTNTCGGTPLLISSVPEPSSYALMGAGLLAVGFTARRRCNV